MKLLTKAALIASAVVVMSGCATGMQPVSGIYADVKGPGMVLDNRAGQSKVGTATAKSVLGIVATGDASIAAAMKEGGITKVHHTDYHTTNIFGIVAETTIVVYGE